MKKNKQKPRFCLEDFSVKNYRGIHALSISNLPRNASWIFLTGENGFGKTSVLQAITIALVGNARELPYNVIDDYKASLSTTFGAHSNIDNESTFNVKFRDNSNNKSLKQEMAYYFSDGAASYTPAFRFLSCYGSSRLDVATENSKEVNPYLSLFETNTLLKNIELQISRWYFKKSSREFEEKYNYVTAILKKLLNLKKIEVNEKTDQVLYYEEDTAGEQYVALPSKSLAAGYRSIINLIGDMILRLFETQPKVNNPALLVGIVIIDEIDLHFHPKWQRKLPSLLSEIFPKIQFIVSTHSAIPLLGAPKNAVFLRVNRNVKEGITIERLAHLEVEIKNMMPNQILTSPIFGLQDIFPEMHDGQDEIRTENTYQEMELTDKVEARLKAFVGTSKEKELANIFKDSSKKTK